MSFPHVFSGNPDLSSTRLENGLCLINILYIFWQVSGMERCILVLVKTGIGVTNNLERRVYEHKNNIVKGFTSKYSVHQLVYYEETNDIYAALQREKQLKKWNRKWKLALIERINPDWNDLAKDWIPAKSMRE